MRLERADTVVLMDLPRSVCLVAVVRRWLRRGGHRRSDMASGCAERFDLEFFRWVWRYPGHSLPRILKQLDEMDASVVVHRLRSRSETRSYVASLAPRP